MVDQDVRHTRAIRADDDRRQVGALMHVTERGLTEVGPPAELGRTTDVPREHEVGERGPEREGALEFVPAEMLPEHETIEGRALGADCRDPFSSSHAPSSSGVMRRLASS